MHLGMRWLSWRRCIAVFCLVASGWAWAADNAWLRQGRPAPVALSAVKILQQAGDDGLNPAITMQPA